MSMRLAVLWLTLLSLCGCSSWMGPAFYSRNEAVNPFPPGRYRVQSQIADKKEMVVRWDGQHLFEDGQESQNMDSDLRNLTVIPLAVPTRELFIVQARTVARDDLALYGVMERTGGRYRVDMPDCKATREIAQAAGATIKSAEAAVGLAEGDDDPGRQSASDLCLFANRASLEGALRRYITERELSGALIERLGD